MNNHQKSDLLEKILQEKQRKNERVLIKSLSSRGW